jgi:hypothetical protein
MPSNQECLFHAGLVVELAVEDLRGSMDPGVPLHDFEIREICERLEIASTMIRRANGGVG